MTISLLFHFLLLKGSECNQIKKWKCFEAYMINSEISIFLLSIWGEKQRHQFMKKVPMHFPQSVGLRTRLFNLTPNLRIQGQYWLIRFRIHTHDNTTNLLGYVDNYVMQDIAHKQWTCIAKAWFQSVIYCNIIHKQQTKMDLNRENFPKDRMQFMHIYRITYRFPGRSTADTGIMVKGRV